MISRNSIIRFIFILPLAFLLVGCPRFAYIEIYNNTTAVLSLDSQGEKRIINPDTSVRIKFGGDSFKLESDLGSWNYQRNIPYGGEDSLYFDGTLKVQVNNDGILYIMKVEESPPISDFSSQPFGYPMLPK